MHQADDLAANNAVSPSPNRQGRLVFALFAAGLSLRPPLILAAALLPQMRAEFGLSYAEGGLLTAIPVFCMGLFALPAGRLYAFLGARSSLAVAIALVAIGGTLRSAVVSPFELYVLTFIIGVGAGLAGALLPAIVRQHLAAATGRSTGIYSLGTNGGASIAATIAIPLASLAGTWRGPSLVFGVASFVSLAVWLALSASTAATTAKASDTSSSAWRLPWAYYLGAIFGLQAICFFGLNTWLLSASIEWGWSELQASWLVGALNVLTVPGSLAVGLLGERLSRQTALCIAASLLAVALTGIAFFNAALWIWVVFAGLACGALFPLIMAMTVDAGRDAKETASIAGVTLAFGYAVGGAAPAVLGAIRDAAHDFRGAFATLIVSALILVVASLAAARRPLNAS
ncbi:MAG TPA: MFS transporter [Bauldia sp.]|nr:MFS transporter [Bauldia sp.]